MTDFIKVDLRSFQDICEQLEYLKAERKFLAEQLMRFANETNDGWKCGDGHFESHTPFEKRTEREFCYHCDRCSAVKGKVLDFDGHTIFVEGV